MMDLSSDVGGPGLPLLDYKTYAERIFFPGQQIAPLSRQLDLPESRRQTVEQGLQQLNNLLNNRLFLTRVGSVQVTSGTRDQQLTVWTWVRTYLPHLFVSPVSGQTLVLTCVCLSVEWRSGQAGHLTLSDEDVTAVVHGRWKRLNTLQHYKVCIDQSQHVYTFLVSRVLILLLHLLCSLETPMLEGEEEEGLRLWHLVKSSEDPEIPKHRKSSMRERERAKAIPEIYLTRLLSMKGTLQKFVDDVFVAILSTKRPPPIAVRFFFDFLDDMAEKHGIDDPETVHIWKTNRYYSDIHSAASGCYQEMNSTLTELSGVN
ncbi:hypothetical protein GOODEAATRI_011004 [Goodea atripinnis]|uniref:Uncharacterized protein n=1 Tax=Goodea atripinnis TaxID=208336 RepID=A0ABV0NJ90_9TELE